MADISSAVTTQLDSEGIEKAKQAIAAYQTSCTGCAEEVNVAVTNLLATGFIGEGANGFKQIYDTIYKVLTVSLIGEEESVTAMLKGLVGAIEQMLNPVDPQIGTANKQAVSATAAAASPAAGNP